MDDDPVASWIHHWLTMFTQRSPGYFQTLSLKKKKNCAHQGNIKSPQQSRPIAAYLTKGWSGVSLTISFIKKESLKATLKARECVRLLNLNRELIPEERSLIAEGSGSHSTLGDFRNYK